MELSILKLAKVKVERAWLVFGKDYYNRWIIPLPWTATLNYYNCSSLQVTMLSVGRASCKAAKTAHTFGQKGCQRFSARAEKNSKTTALHSLSPVKQISADPSDSAPSEYIPNCGIGSGQLTDLDSTENRPVTGADLQQWGEELKQFLAVRDKQITAKLQGILECLLGLEKCMTEAGLVQQRNVSITNRIDSTACSIHWMLMNWLSARDHKQSATPGPVQVDSSSPSSAMERKESIIRAAGFHPNVIDNNCKVTWLTTTVKCQLVDPKCFCQKLHGTMHSNVHLVVYIC